MKIQKKRRQKRIKGELSPFCYLNPSAGDVEAGNTIFNNSISTAAPVSTGGESMGEGIESHDTLLDRQKIFNEIKQLNPNANYKNYENKSIRQMLAIRNNYRDGKKRLVDKPDIPKFKLNKNYRPSDIYLDKHSGDFMIKGLHLGFETEEEARSYIKELNSNEERN